jgi:hypothetical protein
VSRYELGFYIPGDYILLSHRRENLKSYAVILSFQVKEVLITLRNYLLPLFLEVLYQELLKEVMDPDHFMWKLS